LEYSSYAFSIGIVSRMVSNLRKISSNVFAEVHRKLTERNLKSIECKEAQSRAKFNGAILLDVRESQDFEKVFQIQ
jgi:hypothetical protein